MVKLSEWRRSVLAAWDGEPCPFCGRPHPASHVDENGNVWSYCPRYDRDLIVAYEYPPPTVEPEEPEDDLPF